MINTKENDNDFVLETDTGDIASVEMPVTFKDNNKSFKDYLIRRLPEKYTDLKKSEQD